MLNSLFKKQHWARKTERDKWKRWVGDYITLARNHPPKPLHKAKVTFIRHSSAARSPDYDGLVASFKACLDALKIYGIIIDDNPEVIGQPSFSWVRTKPNNGHIEIIVEGVLDGDSV